MSRLHKISNFPLIKKFYLTFILLILYGIYKNGILPFINDYSSSIEMFTIILIPIISFGIGFIFDNVFKNKDIFNSRFYSLLFCMIIPYGTNLILYILILITLLFGYNVLLKKNLEHNFNIIALTKIILIIVLLLLQSYTYQNNLESSALFQYSFIDSIAGHNISGLFTSNIILIIISLLILCTDEYYKKEIPIYSYGIYAIVLTFYTFIKQDTVFLIQNLFSSNILFGLVFIASLSCYTPYSKRTKFIYSSIIGITILPFSLITNFFEGVYISIIFVNILMFGYSLITKKTNLLENFKNLKQK